MSPVTKSLLRPLVPLLLLITMVAHSLLKEDHKGEQERIRARGSENVSSEGCHENCQAEAGDEAAAAV
eukprot:747364-Hanusia_phi.AAC.7